MVSLFVWDEDIIQVRVLYSLQLQVRILLPQHLVRMAELVDARDLSSRGLCGRMGSSPISDTTDMGMFGIDRE